MKHCGILPFPDEAKELTQALLASRLIPEVAQADAALSGPLNRLIAVSEAYPQLRASENFLKLQEELSDIEDKLAAARRYYNQTVYRFNSVQQTFPSVLVARPFGFHERQFFESDQRDPVDVSFARA